MQRITHASAIELSPGKKGFTDGNPSGGVPATIVPAAWLNAVQEEILAVVEAAGLAPSGADLAQLLAALPLIGMPAGTVLHMAASAPPTGWLKCNGAAISRTTYARLFAAIGTQYGAGNGSTTFGLPDLRGEFLRGWDDGRGVDTGRVIGSAQAATTVRDGGLDSAGDATWTRPLILVQNSDGSSSYSGNRLRVSTPQVSTEAGTFSAQASRPRNIALLACIKY